MGWIYESGTWYKFGLSDTTPITSNRFGGETHYGIGEAPDANNRFRITGNVAVTGDIDVSGKYGCSDKYSLATGVNNGNNGVMYSGNGSTTSFAISPGHTAFSVLVFLNGVLPETLALITLLLQTLLTSQSAQHRRLVITFRFVNW